MALDSKLLEILACPNCHGEVDYKEAEQVIECAASATTGTRSATTSRSC